MTAWKVIPLEGWKAVSFDSLEGYPTLEGHPTLGGCYLLRRGWESLIMEGCGRWRPAGGRRGNCHAD